MRAFVGFAGFGGVDIALRERGFDVIGIEIDDDIANVNRINGGNVITADILDVDPEPYTGCDLMHFSPPCPSFSIANQGSSETEHDRLLAHKMAEFIIVCQPQYFTLENVYLYRKSESWAIVRNALLAQGYGLDFWHLNAADYGVPQSRKRMIVIARRDGRKAQKPFPTHSKNVDMFTLPWKGWYQAIEDLIPSLEETQPANWQIKSIPDELKVMLLPVNGEYSTYFECISPAPTISSGHDAGKYRAFIINSQNTTRGLTIRAKESPMMTVSANILEKNSPPIALIVGGQYQTPNDGTPRTVQNKVADSLIWTITTREKGDTIAHENGRWVKMSVRCLARFQGFPDWFALPDDRKLACRGIGNAVPPGLYQAVLRSL
jgi:DNA-cytosine methyltransferase